MKPELRFPEFDGEWEEKQLNNIVDSLKGNSNDNEELPVLTISAKKGWLNQKERFSQVIAGNSLSKYNELKKGDLSYNKGNSKVALYGIVYKLNYDRALVPNVYKSFRPKSNYESDFIEKYFHTKILDKQLRKVITSTARMDGLLNISDNDFYSMLINIPTKKEQQKIGEFFSKLDRQIELEEQKLAKLEEQKKGYMQKVFSQELRFKDENGNNYPEWEEKELGDVATIVGGGTPNTKIAEYWNGDINWFSPVEIGNDIFVNESKSKITELGLKKSSAKLLPTGTVLFTSRAGIGKTAILNSEACTNQGFQSIVPNQSMLDSYYIYSRTNQLKKYAEIVGSGSTFIEVSGVQMRKMPIMLPSITEQEKIGVFFKKIDDSLKKQSDKIGLLKERKKGFLQKMFV